MGEVWPRKPHGRSRQRLKFEVEGARAGRAGCFRKERAVQDETERKRCSRIAQETGRQDCLIGGWQRSGKEEGPKKKKKKEEGTACLALGQPCSGHCYLRTKGKPWQSLKQGRNIIKPVSPTEIQWFKLPVLNGLAPEPRRNFGFKLASAQESPLCPSWGCGPEPANSLPSCAVN